MCKVSVIVPVYNVERYLERCVRSLLCQTLKDIEIILVDDCSPDACGELCDKFAMSDERIKVVHKQNNEGLGEARNTGMSLARGEYISFVDSDDYVDIRMMETLYIQSIEKCADAVYCGFYSETEKKDFISCHEFSENRQFEAEELFHVACAHFEKDAVLNYKSYVTVWRGLFKYSCVKKNGLRFVSERNFPSEDKFFQLDFLKKATKIVYIPDCLYYYCYNGGSLARKFNEKKYELWKLEREKLLEYYKEEEWEQLVNRYYYNCQLSYVASVFSSCETRSRQKKYIQMVFDDLYWKQLEVKTPFATLSKRLKIFFVLLKVKSFFGMSFLCRLIR